MLFFHCLGSVLELNQKLRPVDELINNKNIDFHYLMCISFSGKPHCFQICRKILHLMRWGKNNLYGLFYCILTRLKAFKARSDWPLKRRTSLVIHFGATRRGFRPKYRNRHRNK